MKKRPLYFSFNDALQGVFWVVRTQRNMRIHLALGLLVVIFATVLGVSRGELVMLLLAIGGVFVAEMINTAVEEVVDLIAPDYNPVAGRIKNVAAGAVLVTALTALSVGYLVFVDYFLSFDSIVIRSALPVHYLIVGAIVVIILVIVGVKSLLGFPEPLRGGMPSGHAAVAFSLAVAIWHTSKGWPVLAGFALAILVGQSRIEGEIHKWWEVIAGAAVGVVITLLFFQLKT